jgi:uncharacterized protein (DUF2236 family)
VLAATPPRTETAVDPEQVGRADVVAQPLGPGSLTWTWFAELRGVLLIPRVGVLENLHPELGAGVELHSNVLDDPYDRLFRSLPPIYGVVYDGPRARETAVMVRGFHRHIRGTDSKGRKYNALHPWTFYWAHATFFEGIMRAAEFFGQPFSEDEKRRLYDEHVQWWRLYGMPMTPVPPSWEDWQRYWQDTLTSVLEETKAAHDLLDHATDMAPFSWLPDSVWRIVGWPGSHGWRWLTIGLLPPEAREILGCTWTKGDELALRALGRAIGESWKFVPGRLRYHPRARAGFEREAASQRVAA